MKATIVLRWAAALLLAACTSPAATPTAPGTVPASTSGSVTPSPVGPTDPPASETAAPVPDDLQLSWSEVPFDGSISALAADGSRFVAVGNGTDGVAAWTSSDGLSWVEHDVPERSFGDIGGGVELLGHMGQLVRLGDTLYSFGGMTFMDSARGAAWRSTDGTDWEVIESDSEFFNGRPAVLAASDDALVAGTVSFDRGLYGAYSTWTWTPATSWVMSELSSSSAEEIGVDAMTWADGTFFATGFIAPAVEGAETWEWPRTPAAWTSPDGLDWTAVGTPDGMTSACAASPLADGGFAVIGTAGEAFAAWTLDDDTGWVGGRVEMPAGVDVLPSDTLVAPCSVVEVGDALLATMGTPGGGTLTWTSSDGLGWTFAERLEVATTPPQGSPAARGDVVLMVGSVADPGAESGSRQVLFRATVREP